MDNTKVDAVVVETPAVKKQLDKVAKFAHKNQRLSFRRKSERMATLLERIQPIEEKILDLILQKTPIMDDIEEVRRAMLHECVHPRDQLVHKGKYVLCKFCTRELRING